MYHFCFIASSFVACPPVYCLPACLPSYLAAYVHHQPCTTYICPSVRWSSSKEWARWKGGKRGLGRFGRLGGGGAVRGVAHRSRVTWATKPTRARDGAVRVTFLSCSVARLRTLPAASL